MKESLKYVLVLVFSWAAIAWGYTTGEIGYYMSPAFIEGQRVWAVRKDSSATTYHVVYSDDYGDTWSTFGDALPSDVIEIPSSIFVHSSSHIFFSEASVPCRGARLFKMNRSTGAITVATYLDPTATVHPWGWAQDLSGNLWVGEYGLPWSGHPECTPSQPYNVSYVLKIADSSGNPFSRTATTQSNWTWPRASTPESGMGSWIAPNGAAANLHIHNLRFDPYHNKFLINAGDSPRTFMSWAPWMTGVEDVTVIPAVVDRCCSSGYVLTGFTGLSPMIDGAYVGDDWTNTGRGNSVRIYPWAATASGMGSPTVVTTLPNSYDTPIWDLHASGETEIYFVNYDEPTDTEPNVRLSGLHRLSRASSSVAFSSTFQTLYYAQSSWRNTRYIATDSSNKVPTNVPYIFIYGAHDDANPANRYSVITRVVR